VGSHLRVAEGKTSEKKDLKPSPRSTPNGARRRTSPYEAAWSKAERRKFRDLACWTDKGKKGNMRIDASGLGEEKKS